MAAWMHCEIAIEKVRPRTYGPARTCTHEFHARRPPQHYWPKMGCGARIIAQCAASMQGREMTEPGLEKAVPANETRPTEKEREARHRRREAIAYLHARLGAFARHPDESESAEPEALEQPGDRDAGH